MAVFQVILTPSNTFQLHFRNAAVPRNRRQKPFLSKATRIPRAYLNESRVFYIRRCIFTPTRSQICSYLITNQNPAQPRSLPGLDKARCQLIGRIYGRDRNQLKTPR